MIFTPQRESRKTAPDKSNSQSDQTSKFKTRLNDYPVQRLNKKRLFTTSLITLIFGWDFFEF